MCKWCLLGDITKEHLMSIGQRRSFPARLEALHRMRGIGDRTPSRSTFGFNRWSLLLDLSARGRVWQERTRRSTVVTTAGIGESNPYKR